MPIFGPMVHSSSVFRVQRSITSGKISAKKRHTKSNLNSTVILTPLCSIRNKTYICYNNPLPHELRLISELPGFGMSEDGLYDLLESVDKILGRATEAVVGKYQ